MVSLYLLACPITLKTRWNTGFINNVLPSRHNVLSCDFLKRSCLVVSIYVTGKKCKSHFPRQDQVRWTGSLALYRVTIKAGVYRKAVQLCCIPIPADIYDSLFCNEAMVIPSIVNVSKHSQIKKGI